MSSRVNSSTDDFRITKIAEAVESMSLFAVSLKSFASDASFGYGSLFI